MRAPLLHRAREEAVQARMHLESMKHALELDQSREVDLDLWQSFNAALDRLRILESRVLVAMRDEGL